MFNQTKQGKKFWVRSEIELGFPEVGCACTPPANFWGVPPPPAESIP